ncbi:MAG: cyclase family protein, partial [Clostridiales bacterium]|nr:cyclase family protein [Clostridiales bacterium]
TVAADKYNLTNISLCVHNGTHVDAPRHFIESGAGISKIPLDVFYGKCLVSDKPAPCERLLLKGANVLTEDDARRLVAWGVRLIGVESQSIGDADAPMAVHLILLETGIIPLEGLRLADVPCGEYILSAFPLNLGKDCDGSPVRAVLMTAS